MNAWLLHLSCTNTRHVCPRVPPAETRAVARHVAVFHTPLEYLWSCRGGARSGQFGGLRSATIEPVVAGSLRMVRARHPEQRPWSGVWLVRQTCVTSAPSRRVGRAWGCHAPEWDFPRLCLGLWPHWSLARWRFQWRGGSMMHPWFLSSALRTLWSSLAPLLLSGPRSVRKVVLFGPLCSTGLSLTCSRSSCAFAGVATRLPCHRASCSRAGVPGRRGFALESGGGSRLS